MWVPLLTLSQRYSTQSTPFVLSAAYFLLTISLALLSWSSALHTNKPWRTTSLLSGLFGGPVLNWEDQIVVVTGGSGGIGRVIAETMAVMRVTVVVIDVVDFGEELDDVHYYKCDLSDSTEIEAVAKKIQSEVGHPTILINNAGVVQGKLLLDLSYAELKQTFDVNVLAQFATIKAFLPNMLKNRRGHIVTVSSVFGMQGVAQLSDYCASKHALLGMHESLKYELKYRYNDPPVRLSLLLPAQVQTPLFASLSPPTPLVSFLAPLVTPIDIAKAVIAALDTDQSREICLPVFVGVVWALRGLPSWARDGIVWISGANDAMRTFVKAEKKSL